MLNSYPKKEGKHGAIYQIGVGLLVAQNEWGTWQVLLRQGAERKKKSFGKTEDDQVRAIKAAELLASKIGLALGKQASTGMTFGMMAQKWYELNAGRWRPGTKERYECITREHLQPLANLALDQVNKAQVKWFLADLLKTRSPKTVEVTHAVISGIFTEANELGYTNVNPAHGLLKRVLPAKRKRVRNEPDPFNRQDLETFLEMAWVKLPEPYPLILEAWPWQGCAWGKLWR